MTVSQGRKDLDNLHLAATCSELLSKAERVDVQGSFGSRVEWKSGGWDDDQVGSGVDVGQRYPDARGCVRTYKMGLDGASLSLSSMNGKKALENASMPMKLVSNSSFTAANRQFLALRHRICPGYQRWERRSQCLVSFS